MEGILNEGSGNVIVKELNESELVGTKVEIAISENELKDFSVETEIEISVGVELA